MQTAFRYILTSPFLELQKIVTYSFIILTCLPAKKNKRHFFLGNLR